MMRLVAICMSLPLVLGSTIMAGQQSKTPAAQNPVLNAAEATAGARVTGQASKKPATRHHSKKKQAKTAKHDAAKRPAYRPEYGRNSVEVINGNSTKNVVFQNEQPTALAANSPATSRNANRPSPMKVEVMNGSTTDTQYFYGNRADEQVAAARNQPVVIGVQSSNTRTAGPNRHAVVTGVASAGTADAKAASSGGQPVTNTVSPRPKRPPYQPDMH
jgi:hypothetical protein